MIPLPFPFGCLMPSVIRRKDAFIMSNNNDRSAIRSSDSAIAGIFLSLHCAVCIKLDCVGQHFSNFFKELSPILNEIPTLMAIKEYALLNVLSAVTKLLKPSLI